MPDQSTSLKSRIEGFYAAGAKASGDAAAMQAFLELRDTLEAGKIRAAEPDANTPLGWRVNAWVKQGILLGFRLGRLEASGQDLAFVDKHTFPPRRFHADDGVRVVPGGTSVRAGAFVARGVVAMPPSYIN